MVTVVANIVGQSEVRQTCPPEFLMESVRWMTTLPARCYLEIVVITAPELLSIWTAVEWVIRIGAIIMIPAHRAPAATRSWLLLIFFLPIPGILLFFVIGSTRFPAWRARRFVELHAFFVKSSGSLAAYRPELGAATSISQLAAALGFMPATIGNNVDFIDDYDTVITCLVADIDAATRSVHLLVYIFADDVVGIRVIDALARAVKRGVQTRVMFDAVGSRKWERSTTQRLIAAGVELQQAMPFRFLRRMTKKAKGHRLLQFNARGDQPLRR